MATATALRTPAPKVVPPLQPGFRPAALAMRDFLEGASVPLALALERAGGAISRFESAAYPAGHPRAEENAAWAAFLAKFLLWQRGGFRLHVGGPREAGEQVRAAFHPESFDARFMGGDVYGEAFGVVPCGFDAVPAARESGHAVGRHLDGCRIGFDLGGSDRKASAVVDGAAVWSEEVVWAPKQQADPQWHFAQILDSLERAARQLPRVDAIGGSAAGIYVDNQARVASLFRGVPRARYHEVREIFPRLQKYFGVPLELANDGDVTALAGSMSLGANGVLGIAMGTSQAAGYVDAHGHLPGWLSELAFAPVDLDPSAPSDEWSGAAGAGVQYFSQQAVFRLAPAAGIAIPAELGEADKLKFVQERLEAGHAGAEDIWRSMGVFLGYALAQYADFYELQHVLILGRCTSGRGGGILLDGAEEVLRAEFPELAGLRVQLPDERSRRVGQSIAAASLPALR